MVQPIEKAYLFPTKKSKKIKIKLKSASNNQSGKIYLQGSKNWKIEPEFIHYNLKNKHDEQIVSFNVTPPKNGRIEELSIKAKNSSHSFDRGLINVNYPHIGYHSYFPISKIKMIRLVTKKVINNIGYIMGAGDNVPDVLRELGYNVTVLSDHDVEQNNLSKYQTIITGIRTYNTSKRIKFYNNKLLDYVKNGGNLVVQYNVSYGLKMTNIGPYPFNVSRNRITDETAHLNILNKKHKLFNFPNKITQNDFKNWVQERGLYFVGSVDSKYDDLLSGNDPNDTPKKGSLIFTKYGKGTFSYSGISWFRQLPAGVTGATRLFVNLISAGAINEK
jgi:hypothetical protein